MYYLPVAPLGRKMGMKMPVLHWGDTSPILGAHWLSHIGTEELGSSGPHCSVPGRPRYCKTTKLKQDVSCLAEVAILWLLPSAAQKVSRAPAATGVSFLAQKQHRGRT